MTWFTRVDGDRENNMSLSCRVKAEEQRGPEAIPEV
jgi:hypothetical protein